MTDPLVEKVAGACNADLCELCDAQFDPATECDCRHGEETDDD